MKRHRWAEFMTRLARLRARQGDYVTLMKPGITMMVLVSATAGYFIAARGHLSPVAIMDLLIGVGLSTAAANVLNMVIERRTDALMRRTENRPIPAGRMGVAEALVFGLGLAVAGVGWLALRVNLLAAGLSATTILSYVFVYTPLKARTSLSTIAGAIPGALPPLIGWAAATGTLNFEAWILFGIQFFWQLPHVLALSYYLREDYERAGFALLPVLDSKGGATGRQIVLQSQALLFISLVPALVGVFDPFYFSAALALGLGFLMLGVVFALAPSVVRARRVFLASIIYLPCLLALLAGKAVLQA